MLLKNGLHLTDDDIRFTFEGVYVPEVDFVTGVLSSKKAIAIRISEQEILQNSPFYRYGQICSAMSFVRERWMGQGSFEEGGKEMD